MNIYEQDMTRYAKCAPLYIKILMFSFRKTQCKGHFSYFWSRLFVFISKLNHLEISPYTDIGGGLYLGHPYCITINPNAKLGYNINLHKGVTIGQENRGKRKGVPIIGNDVWIGVNSTIVGNIIIGDDVLIAPNTYVNCDIPNHCVVFGNPCIVKTKENATLGYINNRCEISKLDG